MEDNTVGANRKEGSEKNWNTGLSTAANVVVKFTGGCIFAFLVWYALKYTWYVLPEGREIPVEIEDSVRKNVLSAGLALLFVTVLLFSRFRRGHSDWCPEFLPWQQFFGLEG